MSKSSIVKSVLKPSALSVTLTLSLNSSPALTLYVPASILSALIPPGTSESPPGCSIGSPGTGASVGSAVGTDVGVVVGVVVGVSGLSVGVTSPPSPITILPFTGLNALFSRGICLSAALSYVEPSKLDILIGYVPSAVPAGIVILILPIIPSLAILHPSPVRN